MRGKRKFICLNYHATKNLIFQIPDLPMRRMPHTKKLPSTAFAPENYHSTSMYPEYFKINGTWTLARESRMDSSVVLRDSGELDVVENRNLKKGDKVILGRTENGEEGIYLHSTGFESPEEADGDQFVFRQAEAGRLLMPEITTVFLSCSNTKENTETFSGLWDLPFLSTLTQKSHAGHGGARICRRSHGRERAGHPRPGRLHVPHGSGAGYLHAEIPSQRPLQPSGCNQPVRKSGSIAQFIEDYNIDNGIMYSCVKNNVPFVLTGSIRDDGPLPEVIGDAYAGQTAMRGMVKKATTVICLATMLHTIATGNMTPSYRVLEDGTVRPVFLYTVDADEFVVNKLLDRGSLAATTIVTNVQDFIMIVAKGTGDSVICG